MKKLLKKLRDWLIVKLGGVTRENAESILEYWDKDVHKLAILTEKNASLEQTNNSLRVTEVRCQDLQDITDAGARAEGLGDPDVIYTRGALPCMFAELWDSTVPKDKQARARKGLRAVLQNYLALLEEPEEGGGEDG